MLSKSLLFVFLFLTKISCWAQEQNDGDGKREGADAGDGENADGGVAKAKVLFVNNQDHPVSIYWSRANEKGDHHFLEIGKLEEGATDTIEASIGEEFSFADGGRIRTVRIDQQEDNVLLIGPEEFRVRCETSEGPIHINIVPRWAPHGAARFIALVKAGYYDGNALLVDQSAARFGIGPDHIARTELQKHPMQDDRSMEGLLPFRPSYVTFVGGAGSNTRTSEVVIIMPNAPDAELNELGQYPWATPFGFVDSDNLVNVGDKWYNDQEGEEKRESPDPSKIYEEGGYDYLRREFPDLSYTGKCEFVPFPSPDEGKEEL